MLEIGMAICLTIMGIYFFKSTDLPKDMKERSSMLRVESEQMNQVRSKKMSFNAEARKTIALEVNQEKLAVLNQAKKTAELKILQSEIDNLTLLITELEQEIRANNERNSEIQNTIDNHLVSLQLLQEKLSKLS